MEFKVPVIINNRNWYTLPRDMVFYVSHWKNVSEIVIVDNDSTYPPCLEWYDKLNNVPGIRVIKLARNGGHCAPWDCNALLEYPKGIVDSLAGTHYIVSDPDLDLSHVPIDAISRMLTGLNANPMYNKCGLSLEINDIPKGPLIGINNIMAFEGLHWANRVHDNYFMANTDTTMALYEKSRNAIPGDFNKSIRCDRPYTARHLPWYITKDNITEEAKYYIEHCEGYSLFASRSKI